MATIIFTSNFDAITMHIYNNYEVHDTISTHATKDDARREAFDIVWNIKKSLNAINYELNGSEFYINTDEDTLEYDDSKYRFSIYIYE